VICDASRIPPWRIRLRHGPRPLGWRRCARAWWAILSRA
jgi:hypothetical protein